MAAAGSPLNLAPELMRRLAPAVELSGGQVRTVPIGVAQLDEMLPDQGLARGAVVEISARRGLAQSSSIALRVCSSAQAEATVRAGQPAWCVWLDPCGTLYAPGVAAHGICLDRFLVIRPPLSALARMAVRVTASRVFSVVVIDTAGVIGAEVDTPLVRWANVVRRLAIAAQGSDSCVVLLTDAQRSREALLPVAMRLEIAQSSAGVLAVRVAKERRGRIGMIKELVYARPQASVIQRAG
jgi:hypothetical protein